MTITGIIGLIIPLAQLYLLFRIWRSVATMADESDRKKELNDNIKKFAAMFAEAGLADVPKPPRNYKPRIVEE